MKKKTNSVVFFFGLALVFVLFQSNRSGRPDTYAGAPSDDGVCANCHTTPGAGSIALTGVPVVYEAGVTYDMTLTLNDAAAIVGGFQIVATNGVNNALVGTFNPDTDQTLNNVNRLVQSTPAFFAGGSVSWPISWTAPAAGAPANLQFYFAGNAANNNFGNGAGDMGYNGSSVLIPLPVELLSFELEAADKATVLNWATASEINSSHFEIERSTDGKYFSTIGEVAATGTTYQAASYSYTDQEAVLNKTNYYRLKIVDFDGQYNYSAVAGLVLESAEERRLKLYPNPAFENEVLTIDLEETTNKAPVSLGIFNSLGQQVYARQIDPDTAMPLHMPMNDWAAGIYFVRLSNNTSILAMERLVLR